MLVLKQAPSGILITDKLDAQEQERKLMKSVQFVDSEFVLGGRRFEPVGERALHSMAAPVIASLPGRGGKALAVPEMIGPLGVPDFVALVGGEAWLGDRINAGVAPILSKIDCTVLATMSSKRALSVESISRRIQWSIDETEPVIKRLVRAGAIEETPAGSFLINSGMTPSGAIFAIETKLRDWRRAVIQARGYRTWASNYVLVLGDIGPVATRRAASVVSGEGGGLFVRSGWLARPHVRHPMPVQRLLGYEYFFAAISRSDPSFITHKIFDSI